MLACITSQVPYVDRPKYRRKDELLPASSRVPSFSRPSSFRNPPCRTVSLNNPIVELKPLEVSCICFIWPQRDLLICMCEMMFDLYKHQIFGSIPLYSSWIRS